MSIKRNQGFTLIELLVVIAIIGILSAVVLASLSTARQKGQDAAVQSDLATVQTQAEIYYGDPAGGNNTYGATVSNTPGVAGAGCPQTTGIWANTTIKNAVINAIAVAKGGAVNCNSTSLGYAIQGQLTAPTGTQYWCVDSAGKTATSSTALPSAQITCP